MKRALENVMECILYEEIKKLFVLKDTVFFLVCFFLFLPVLVLTVVLDCPYTFTPLHSSNDYSYLCVSV